MITNLRYIIFCLLIISTKQAFSVSAKAKNRSSIEQVTLFKDRAYIKRSKKVSLNLGGQSVVFSGLTPILDKDTLKVTLSNKDKCEILGVRTVSNFNAKSFNGELKVYLKQKAKLDLSLKKLHKEVQGLIKEHSNLREIVKHYHESFTLNLHTKKWSKSKFSGFLKFMQDRRKKMFGPWKVAYKRYLKITKQLRFVNAKIKQLRSISNYKNIDVVVDLSVTVRGSVTVGLQYLVKNVGWRPFYNIRLNSSEKTATLEQHALITQRSGEDWDNVNLILNNLQTRLKIKAPTITPYTLNWQEVKKVQTHIESVQDVAASLNTSSLTLDDAQTASGLAKNFIIVGRQSIADGMVNSMIFIYKNKLPYEEHLEVVPNQYPHVYKKGKIINNLQWALAPGIASVFYDGKFVQKIQVSQVRKGDTFSINAGLDHSIVVKTGQKQKVTNNSMIGGLIDKTKTYKRVLSFNLENFSKHSKKIKVLGQIPRSELKELKVETKGSTEGFKPLPGTPSWVFWDLLLGSRQSKALTLSLEVTAPEEFHFNW
ncbi:MAG: mucoidy inhibitor MuiA family protein [Bacteriovoracaceae bacterium]|nr:mucoidy inhibitor MuiA family protein [Bacteriovoracaceae bacterium]